jgi:hypothetical protein
MQNQAFAERTPSPRKGNLFPALSLMAGLCILSTNTLAHVISEEDHHAFEHKYADICVKKELKRQGNGSGYVDEALSKLCTCIAEEQSKHLTLAEVKRFLQKNEYPVSLMIKADHAEYVCSQKK